MKEKDLFPFLKKHFKEQGFKVYSEVACFYRGVDFVAVKGDEHIAVEMKMSFNKSVIYQASGNITSFGNSYVAYPVKKATMFHNDEAYWKLRESVRNRYEFCRQRGIGIMQIILPHGIIFTALEAVYQKPYRIFDFSQYKERATDEAGLPCQKGVSEGYYELKAIKAYVRKHPEAKWKEIYDNVQNHYSSPQSLAGSMSQWRGFSLNEFKKIIPHLS